MILRSFKKHFGKYTSNKVVQDWGERITLLQAFASNKVGATAVINPHTKGATYKEASEQATYLERCSDA
jgi:hypothetical protein